MRQNTKQLSNAATSENHDVCHDEDDDDNDDDDVDCEDARRCTREGVALRGTDYELKQHEDDEV